jgi:lipid-binding SYLF domain-containing protein
MNTKENRWTKYLGVFLFVITLSGVLVAIPAALAQADDKQEATQIVQKACMALDNFMSDNHMGAFRNLLERAKAAVIAPSLLKGAFIIGASGGHAVGMVRDEHTGRWSEPSFYTIGGASFGLQIGAESSEVILLAMTERGVNALMDNSFKLGVDAGVAAGPVGIGAQAASSNLSADILSFSRSKGLYGGISLDGAVVAMRKGLNDAYYGKTVSAKDIFVRHDVRNPQTVCLTHNLIKSTGNKNASVR